MYGAVGNNYFRYYNRDMARSITLAGQMYINKSALNINKFISNALGESNNVIQRDRLCYIDTDSVYFELVDVLNKFYEMKPDADRNTATDFIDRFCKKIESDCLQPLFDKMKVESNCHPDGVMHMDREAICIPYKKTGHSAIWTAKKRYIAMVSDMEGFRYEEPHRKIMGLFSVTSSCPEFIKPVYNRVLEELISEGVETARKSITDFKKEFYKKSVEEISFPKSVSDVIKYTDPKTGKPWEGKWYDASSGKERNGGVPVNSKAAICHNYLIKKLGLEKKYQLIKDGDKIKFAWLKENPYGFSVIGFKEDFPEEFGLKQFVSYDLHWEKLFYSPMTDIFSACGLTVENVLSIEDFF